MVGRGDWNGETSLHDNSSDDSATINGDFILIEDGSSAGAALVCYFSAHNSLY